MPSVGRGLPGDQNRARQQHHRGGRARVIVVSNGRAEANSAKRGKVRQVGRLVLSTLAGRSDPRILRSADVVDEPPVTQTASKADERTSDHRILGADAVDLGCSGLHSLHPD